MLMRKLSGGLRDAFEELALHARLQAAFSKQHSVAAKRLVRALRRPETRLALSCFTDWISYRGSPQALWSHERRNAMRKRIHLGGAILNAFMRDAGRNAIRAAITQLARHAE